MEEWPISACLVGWNSGVNEQTDGPVMISCRRARDSGTACIDIREFLATVLEATHPATSSLRRAMIDHPHASFRADGKGPGHRFDGFVLGQPEAVLR